MKVTRPEPPEPVLPDQAELTQLSLSNGILDPAFSSDVYEYTATVTNEFSSVGLTLNWSSGASVTVNGTAQASQSMIIALNEGENFVEIVVTAEDGVTTNTYNLTITRLSDPDTTPPVITLAGDNPLYLEVHRVYEEPGFSASDAEEGNLGSGVGVFGLG